MVPVFAGVTVIYQIPTPVILTEEIKEVIPFDSGVSKDSHPVNGFQMKHCRFLESDMVEAEQSRIVSLTSYTWDSFNQSYIY